jgi:hypothetical protein
METVLVESTSQAVICSVMEMVEVRNGAQGPRVADVVPLAEHPGKITLVRGGGGTSRTRDGKVSYRRGDAAGGGGGCFVGGVTAEDGYACGDEPRC